jgi:hypothetical protein
MGHESAYIWTDAANLYEDLLALRSEGISDHVYFAKARAFLAKVNLQR